MDRRFYERIIINMPCLIYYNNKELKCRIFNISENGINIKIDMNKKFNKNKINKFSIGDRFKILFVYYNILNDYIIVNQELKIYDIRINGKENIINLVSCFSKVSNKKLYKFAENCKCEKFIKIIKEL